MSLKDLVIGGVAVVALLLALLSANQPAKEIIRETLGTASSPSVINGCLEVNGQTKCYYSQKMTFASTTCSFRAPQLGSSTLEYAAINLTNRGGGTFDGEWGKAFNSANATTTSLGYAGAVITTGGDFYISASTTPITLTDGATKFAITEYLNFKIGSTVPSTLSSGACTAVFNIN
jgi:hypothetical protein